MILFFNNIDEDFGFMMNGYKNGGITTIVVLNGKLRCTNSSKLMDAFSLVEKASSFCYYFLYGNMVFFNE